MKIWTFPDGYEAWGVQFPNGHIREFPTEDAARKYIAKMEGAHVLTINGPETWVGLKVKHRQIPAWTDVQP